MDSVQLPVTAASLEAWATEAFHRRMSLHLQRTSPVQVEREQAFTLMSALVVEATAIVKSLAHIVWERDQLVMRWERDQAAMWWEGDGAGV